jgi:hypothetical protein
MPRADERFGGPSAVTCRTCGATVQVTKFSPQHTSVQWTAAAARICPVLSAPPSEFCEQMRESIAVAPVEITPP